MVGCDAVQRNEEQEASHLVAIAVITFGVWMSTHHDGCRKSLTLPVLGLGVLILVISIVGFLGALKNNSILLWIYLIMLFIILVAILVFTALAFMVTNNGSGHSVAGLRRDVLEYLEDHGTSDLEICTWI